MARRKSSDDYAVGYGRPPASGRFRPGQSGNPKGRPKAPRTLDETLHHRLARKVAVTESGRRKRITLLEVIVGRLVKEAAAGDARWTALLLKFLAQRPAMVGSDEAVPKPSPEEDMAALRELIDSMGGSLAPLLADLAPEGEYDEQA